MILFYMEGKFINLSDLVFRHLLIISSGFFAVGLIIGAKSAETLPLLISMIGFLLFAISFLVNLQCLLFKIHDLHKSLDKLKEAAEDLSVADQLKKELQRDIGDLEPISGYGLFTVDRTTLTSTVSVSITYLIVLLQFKQSSVS